MWSPPIQAASTSTSADSIPRPKPKAGSPENRKLGSKVCRHPSAKNGGGPQGKVLCGPAPGYHSGAHAGIAGGRFLRWIKTANSHACTGTVSQGLGECGIYGAARIVEVVNRMRKRRILVGSAVFAYACNETRSCAGTGLYGPVAGKSPFRVLRGRRGRGRWWWRGRRRRGIGILEGAANLHIRACGEAVSGRPECEHDAHSRSVPRFPHGSHQLAQPRRHHGPNSSQLCIVSNIATMTLVNPLDALRLGEGSNRGATRSHPSPLLSL
jgi:hypothetical protein